jgi:peptidoglycan/LPS O-acetylase OafA/YrhL
MNKLGIILGVAVLAVAFAAAPMPLTVILENPTRNVTIYPNLLFAVPLMLLGALLLLYGVVSGNNEGREKPAFRQVV